MGSKQIAKTGDAKIGFAAKSFQDGVLPVPDNAESLLCSVFEFGPREHFSL